MIDKFRGAPSIDTISFKRFRWHAKHPRTPSIVAQPGGSHRGLIIRSYQSGIDEIFHCRLWTRLHSHYSGPSNIFPNETEQYRPRSDDPELQTITPWVDTTDHKGEDCRMFFSCNRNPGWKELTDYRGHMVPLAVLKKVYQKAGMQWDWSTPGRGMELPDAAWEVLRQWRARKA